MLRNMVHVVRDVAEKYLHGGLNAEGVKEAVRKLAGDDVDEYNKLICLCRYYCKQPSRIKWSKQFEKNRGRNDYY